MGTQSKQSTDPAAMGRRAAEAFLEWVGKARADYVEMDSRVWAIRSEPLARNVLQAYCGGGGGKMFVDYDGGTPTARFQPAAGDEITGESWVEVMGKIRAIAEGKGGAA